MKKTTFLIIGFSLFVSTTIFAQVGVGTTIPNAAMDITSANDGVLIPRIALAATNIATVITPTSSELVYNTFTSAVGPNQVTPGFYYWDGALWIRIATGNNNNDWLLTGNTGTTAGTNFIGTTDAVDFRIKTGGNDRWNISNANNGQLQSFSLGSNALPTYSFQGDPNTGMYSSAADALDFTTGGTARFRIPNANQVHALALGTAPLPFYTFSADSDTGLFSPVANNLAVSTNGTEKVRVDANGKVGIGATAPNGMLEITSANDGLIIPRIALAATNIATVATPTTSELVYNTATAGAGLLQVTPGFYYWDGAQWIRVATGNNNDWSITGNAGTVAATNFIGTTDNIPLRIRTANIERFEFPGGGAGTQARILAMTDGTAAIPNYSWNSDSNTGIYRAGPDVLGITTLGNERMRVRADGNVAINSVGNATDRLSVDDVDYPINAYGTGTAGNHTAIYGSQSGLGSVIWGENFKAASDNTAAVFGESELTRDPGIEGRNNFANSNSVGVFGLYNITNATDGTGVFGRSAASAAGPGWGYGVRGEGNFYGVFAQGDLGATGAKTFLIDHPLDPENKSLKHFSIESNEVLNVYRGNTVFDAAGNARIKLPDYFNSINRNFSYQLTAVGAAMPNLFVAEKINATGEFIVSGGVAGKEVSWTVYGERNDKYLQTNPEKRETEISKKQDQAGKYWDAKSWGRPESQGILYTPYNPNMSKEKVQK